MKTFHEWLAMREGLWLNDKNAVVGMSNVNPLKTAKPKPMKRSKASPSPATPKPFKLTPPAVFKPTKSTVVHTMSAGR